MKLIDHIQSVIEEVIIAIDGKGVIAEVQFDGMATTKQTLAGDGDTNYESTGVRITVVVGEVSSEK